MPRRLWPRTPALDFAYTESLWDRESNARLLGITHAPDLPHVRERPARLRDDPMEEAEVRAVAGKLVHTTR